MTSDGPGTGGECQFRDESRRCIFVDGHSGAHVCIGAHSSRVAIRGHGEIPETTYLSRLNPPTGGSDSARSALVSGEDIWGEWTEPMLRRLLVELEEAGASPPRDWLTNFHRLKASSDRS